MAFKVKVKEFAFVAYVELLICICSAPFSRSWPTERAGGPLAWFYIPRPFCQAIAEGFQDCTRIARGLRIVLDF